MSGVIVSVEGHATSERRSRGRAETDWSRVESRDESRTEAKTRQNAREPAETKRREEAPAETKRVSKERRKAREKMLELVWRALLRVYRKSATAAVMLHVESDLHEHANGRRKRRTSSTSSATHSSSSRARLHNARACDNTAYISNDLMNKLTIFCLAILLHDDIID